MGTLYNGEDSISYSLLILLSRLAMPGSPCCSAESNDCMRVPLRYRKIIEGIQTRLYFPGHSEYQKEKWTLNGYQCKDSKYKYNPIFG